MNWLELVTAIVVCFFKGHIFSRWMYSHADDSLYRECFRCGKWEHKGG